MKKYKTYVLSILAILIITVLFLSIQSVSYFNLTAELSSLFTNFSISNLNLIIHDFLSYFTLVNSLNVSFLVSLLFLCVYGFKWLSDKGAYYTFQYSWQKNKRHVLFFLPKYWGSHKNDQINKDDDLDLETGEKIYHTFESFVEYKQTTRWDNINQLFASAITIIILTIIISYTFA